MYLAQRFISLKRAPRVLIFVLSTLIINQTALNTNAFSNGPLLCTFRRVTGALCPFCGGTRSVGLISEGKFLDAMSMNPVGYIFVLFVLCWVVRPELLRQSITVVSKKWWILSSKRQYLFLALMYISIWLLNLPRML